MADTEYQVTGIEMLGMVLPGDEVVQYNPTSSKEHIFLGPGLRWEDNTVRATKPGLLKKNSKKVYFVDTHQRRYIPQKREYVIGTVLKRKGDIYTVDIGASEQATISFLSFENASKKTRTELCPGDLLYGQLLVANKHMEPELVCIDAYDRAVGMGPLPEGGILFHVPLHVARTTINPENPFLYNISKKVDFSIVVGFNGRIWIKAKEQKHMVAIMHCILLLDVMSVDEANDNVLRVLDKYLRQ